MSVILLKAIFLALVFTFMGLGAFILGKLFDESLENYRGKKK